MNKGQKDMINDGPEILAPTIVLPTINRTRIIPLKLISMFPEVNEIEVSPFVEIRLVFNRPILNNEVTVKLLADLSNDTEAKITIKQNQIIIFGQNLLTEQTVYKVKCIETATGEILADYNFATKKSLTSKIDDGNSIFNIMKDKNRKERPDIFLANEMPYVAKEFQMDVQTTENGEFEFVVKSTNSSGISLKRIVEEWLLSLELTKKQIDSLIIIY